MIIVARKTQRLQSIKFLIVVLFSVLISCQTNNQSEKKSSHKSSFADSLFILNSLKHTSDYKGTNNPKYFANKLTAKKLYLSYLNKKCKTSAIDSNNITVPDIIFVTKLKTHNNIQPIIINATNEELDELLLITVNDDLTVVDVFCLSGNEGCVGINESNFPYLKLCPERESKINDYTILTFHKKITNKVGNSSEIDSVIIDSLTFKTTINKNGTLTTNKIDSIRIKRKKTN